MLIFKWGKVLINAGLGLCAYSEPTFMKADVIFDCEWVWTCFYLNGSQQVYMTEILRLTVSRARNIPLTNDVMLQSHFELVQTYIFLDIAHCVTKHYMGEYFEQHAK